ncbi:protocatechuate 3,4-dioxygenase subunit alpha [Amycolatopsis suaedae]|uniref:Protocatechuate 3,4-dioxygenase subunit alpha n=1 Tax=Amycolatopsis suaedae TaxID=2510978 RepID=A0A4Q7JA49_9PSEU|nr:protocatechuate 3,4-dioxygenase subunit alpha [Amycolatopsis suaedae]RZQ63888.1 protocatechuate 3,4-dioxygenase subunit alpha [Amycolatopsis suaedae]
MTERGLTPSQTVGPFLAIGLDWPDGPEVVAEGTAGAILVEGTVFDGAGTVVPDALVEIWQAGPDGRFGTPGFGGFGRCATDPDGRFWFRTLRPGAPGDGQAPHIDVTVFARGLMHHLVTRLYLPGEAEANAADPVLTSLPEDARRALVAEPGEPGRLRFDIHLQGPDETPFFAV